jgi:hypothetical protein
MTTTGSRSSSGLAKLKDSGPLSAEEFERVKARILGS